MNEKEKKFKESILNKINKYYICSSKNHKVTFNECLKKAKNEFILNSYSDGSEDETIDIGIEKYLCELSPLYFISKYCTFTLPGLGVLSADKLYYYQKEILKKFPYYKKIVLDKSRQTGLSTLASLLMLWKMIFQKKQWGVIISKDGKSSTDLLDKVKENLKNIPSWAGVKVTANNVKGLKFSNGSKIDSFARSKSAGRGTSPTFCILDEAAFYQTESIIEGIVSSVVPSLTRTSGTLMVISTPNGTTGEGAWYYDQVQELKRCGNEDGTSILFPIEWWECPDIDGIGPYKGYNDILQQYIDRDYFNNPAVKEEAMKFFAPIAEDPKKNEWLKFQFEASGEVKYRQEILKDFIVMGNSVFSATIINRVQQRVSAPIIDGDLGNRYYKGLWIWREPEPNARYIIGVDVAKGTANDNSVVEVLDMDTLEQVAEYMGKCSTHELAGIANEVGHHYNNARIYVECNAIGEAVFNELFYNYAYENMFSMKKINKLEKNMVWTGWMTSTKTRQLITDCLIDYYYKDDQWTDYHPHSQRLLDQMKQWVWAGGRPDHNSNAHDDAILAMAILLYNIPTAKQSFREKNEISFIAEDGREIRAGGSDYQQKKVNERTSDSYNRDYDSYSNQEAQRSMASSLGMPDYGEDYENPLDIYKWLIS